MLFPPLFPMYQVWRQDILKDGNISTVQYCRQRQYVPRCKNMPCLSTCENMCCRQQYVPEDNMYCDNSLFPTRRLTF